MRDACALGACNVHNVYDELNETNTKPVLERENNAMRDSCALGACTVHTVYDELD